MASAVILKPEVTEETLRQALLGLMHDHKYTENAKAMSQEMRTTGGCEKAAQAVIDYLNKT